MYKIFNAVLRVVFFVYHKDLNYMYKIIFVALILIGWFIACNLNYFYKKGSNYG